MLGERLVQLLSPGHVVRKLLARTLVRTLVFPESVLVVRFVFGAASRPSWLFIVSLFNSWISDRQF